MVEFEYPFDELAERAVLGAMLKNPESIPAILEYLREEDFYFETHRQLFSLLCKVWKEKGKNWDDMVLRSYLEKSGLQDRIRMDWVYALAKEAAEGQRLFEAIKRVKEKAGLRHEIAQKSQVEYSHVKDAIAEGLAFIDSARNSEGVASGLPTGFIDLDRLTAGFQPSDLVVIAARPGMGKSSFMLSIVLHLALNEKVPLAIFSLETSKKQLALRMLSMFSGVPLQNIRQGFVRDEDLEKIGNAALELSSKSIYIDDNPNLTTTELRIKSKKLKKEKGVEIIFVDYLQLLGVPYRRISRQEEVAEISRNLKALAKELQIPVVALAQLSRQVEQRSDKRPQLADLRESGQIEQDADLIIFIHRPEVYKKHPPPEEEGLAEIIVAKQRQGPTGIVKLAFDKDTTAFKPLPSVYSKGVEEYLPEIDISLDDLDVDF
jgi:replicative DNA helicase